jgi:HK97 gp10 family phage protein
MEFKAEVKGLSKLEENLRALPDNLARKAVKAAVKDGGDVIQNEMVRLAPRNTGFLASHIVVQVKMDKFGEAVAKIGPAKDAFWGGFNEFGTRFMRAQPFMRPAFDLQWRVALERIRLRLADEIKKYTTIRKK